ncbi:helicase-exonuclease AddAB subunit AddB [Paenibacillus daejeonensis]|uniref:helicase-exonuclease AddAB subunit AddB n=1 Tax=Paenibacillus daejeonensis TaxID=135193 RepID=UPI000365C8A8|nr:helicase-exonuclease AddAB subunit AddB [Paenibacillus daejeonensis]
MTLRMVLGRSGAGKTRLCMDELLRELHQQAEGDPLILLVPEQATFQTEYALARSEGLAGTIRAQALSFRRLAFRVMQETGGSALVPITEDGKHMMLYKILHRIGPQLQLYQGAGEQQGFIERLGELLTEWKRYAIAPETIEDYTAVGAAISPLLERKLEDLKLIYGQLETELAGFYLDSEDYLSWLAHGGAQSSILRGAKIWIDGFHGFTPRELEALGVLLQEADEVTVTLTLDRPYGPGERPHELDLFHPTAETYIQLQELAERLEVARQPDIILDKEPPVRFDQRPDLAHLERHFVSRIPMLQAKQADGQVERGISIHQAVHRRAEVEAVARDMIERVRNGGCRWRDMAVMVRDSASYADYIEQTFTEYGIPYFLDQKSDAHHHPLVEFVRSALETVVQGWRYDAIFRCIKTEMLLPEDGLVKREAMDRLENYILASGIDGSRWLDRKRWRPLIQDSLDGSPEEVRAGQQRAFDEVMDCRELIVGPLGRFGQRLKQAANVREMCEALYRLLDHTEAAERMERWSREAAERGELRRAREHRQLWEGIMDLLDQLVEMAGEEQISRELFAGMLEAGLSSLKLAAVPPSLDQVLVGNMERTRTGHIGICYILGAVDGVLPMRVQEDGILTEAERERLAGDGIVMAPGVRRRLLDERFLIYNALTLPSRHLWISYPASDTEGKSLLPSEIIRHLKQMFPGLEEHVLAGEPERGSAPEEQLAYVARPGPTMSRLIAQLRHWHQGEAIDGLWWQVYNWYAARPEWRRRLTVVVSSLRYSNEESPLAAETASQLYGERLSASVSRMERFVSCPFQHFAIHGLRLQERRLYRLDAPDIGQLFHAALSRLAAEMAESWGSQTEEQIRGRAAKAVEELAPRLQSEILLSSSRFQYIARKLAAIVAQAAVILGEHARRASFTPVGLELDFGGKTGTLPALEIPLSGGHTMEIIGRIDRVDAAQTEDGMLLRVIDYKSSSTSLRLEEVVHGLSLQMLTYLDVLLTHAPAWLGQPAIAAGVLYFHVHNPMLLASNRLEGEEARQLILKRFKLKGLLLADEQAIRMMDGGLGTGHSELLPVAIKKDGGFYGSSSVVTGEQWETLRHAVRSTIRTIGERITCGEVAITPYRLGAQSPCTFCSYKPVCQFDPLFEGNDYVRLRKQGKDELWLTLAERAATAEEPAEVGGQEEGELPDGT